MKRLILGLGLVALAARLHRLFRRVRGTLRWPGGVAPGRRGRRSSPRTSRSRRPRSTVPADEPVTIVMDNQEDAPHNISIKDAPGPTCSRARSSSNQQITYAVDPLAAGTYPFFCEVHPDMTGTITAE